MDVVKGQGFWTSLAKNLKELVLDEAPGELESYSTPPVRRSKEDPLTSRDAKRENSTKSPLSRSKSQQQGAKRQPREVRLDSSSIGSPSGYSPSRMGFMQGGLDAIVSSISLIGDTLGTALEESIQRVADTAMNDAASPQHSLSRGREPVEESPNHERPTANPGDSPAALQEVEEEEPQGQQAKPLKARQAKGTHTGATAEAESPATPDKAPVPVAALKAEAVSESDEASEKVGREAMSTATSEAVSVGSKVVERAGVPGSVRTSVDKQQGGKPQATTFVVVSGQAAGKAAGGRVQPNGKVPGGGKQPTLIVPNETQLMASRNVATAMAMRAKQLQADVKAARKDAMEAREQSRILAEENAKLQAALVEARRCNGDCGCAEAVSTEQEDMLREQLEAMLQEKRKIMTDKAGVERENEMLHQLLLYYEHMYMREESIITPLEESQDVASP